MEVLSVDLANRLSSSSSRSQQEITFKIKQTHNQTMLMQDDSKQLLTVYAFKQGPPFGNADFNPPVSPYPGLPLPSISPKDWLDLSDAERLQKNVTVFSNLPEFLEAVKRHQDSLNPNAEELYHQLETSTMQCQGLTVNLKSIMAAMGITPDPSEPVELPKPGSDFLKKLSGYNICQLYRQWVNRCEKDMALLATKYSV